jgi:predicted S18 family serine protease
MLACLVAVVSGGYSNVKVSAKRTLEADRLCDEAQQAREKKKLLAILREKKNYFMYSNASRRSTRYLLYMCPHTTV